MTESEKIEAIKQQNNLEIINLGTGMGYYDFHYDDIPLKAFNFSLPQQNLYFDYQLLKEYAHVLNKNCVICLVLPYFIFCADRLEEVMRRYERYYSLLPQKIVEPYCHISYEEWKVKDKEILPEDDSLKYVLKRDVMKIQSEEAIRNWKHQLGILSFSTGEVSSHTRREMERTQKWLKMIFKFCEQEKFYPVVIVPPMSRALLEKISIRFRRLNYYDILEGVVPDTVRILDYSDNDFFCDPELYGWPGFLIEDAAKMFTVNVIDQLGLL